MTLLRLNNISLGEIDFNQLIAVLDDISITLEFWLIFALVSLILGISCYIILLSDNDMNDQGYLDQMSNFLIRRQGLGFNGVSRCHISRKIGYQTVINHTRQIDNLPPLNYREFDNPLCSLNFDERVKLANILKSSPFKSEFDIDTVYGSITYKNRNELLKPEMTVFAWVFEAERRSLS